MTAVLVGDTARAHIDEIHAWWLTNRPAAPDLFADELGAALVLLAEAPHAGEPYPHQRVMGVRRVLMLRC